MRFRRTDKTTRTLFSTFFLLLPFTKMSALLFFFPSPFFFSTRFIYGDEYHFRPDGVEGALVVIRSSSAATAQSVEFFSLEATDNPALLKIDDKSPNYTARKTFAVTTVLSTRNSSRAPKFNVSRRCGFASLRECRDTPASFDSTIDKEKARSAMFWLHREKINILQLF